MRSSLLVPQASWSGDSSGFHRVAVGTKSMRSGKVAIRGVLPGEVPRTLDDLEPRAPFGSAEGAEERRVGHPGVDVVTMRGRFVP